jgi:hypothetical protein
MVVQLGWVSGPLLPSYETLSVHPKLGNRIDAAGIHEQPGQPVGPHGQEARPILQYPRLLKPLSSWPNATDTGEPFTRGSGSPLVRRWGTRRRSIGARSRQSCITSSTHTSPAAVSR